MLSIVARRVPATLTGRAILVRTYASGGREGSVAQSREFGKKERGEEDQYSRRHDAELLRKLKAELEEKKRHVDELESKVKEAESK